MLAHGETRSSLNSRHRAAYAGSTRTSSKKATNDKSSSELPDIKSNKSFSDKASNENSNNMQTGFNGSPNLKQSVRVKQRSPVKATHNMVKSFSTKKSSTKAPREYPASIKTTGYKAAELQAYNHFSYSRMSKEESKKSASCSRKMVSQHGHKSRYDDAYDKNFRETGYGSNFVNNEDDCTESSGDDLSEREEDDYFDDDEQDESDYSPARRATKVPSSHKKRKVLTRGSSAGLIPERQIPLMRYHKRKNKKVPGTVRKPTNDTVVLLKNPIKGRLDTTFFSYPAYVGKEKQTSLKLKTFTQDQIISKQLIFKIAETTNIYNSVVNSCKNAGMYLVDSGKDWNLLFCGYVRGEFLREVHKYQRINHFPCSYEIGRKDRLWKNIARMKRKFGTDYNICPNTYVLPTEYRRFVSDFKMKEYSKAMWILKPCAQSCGKGIKIFSAQSKMPKNKKGHIISRYISRPHLISGRKYDMRIYVLVVSVDPLVIYMFNDGLVRFSTEKYSLKPKNLNKQCVHLTNYSINKKADNYVKNTNKDSDNEGGDDENLSKWSYSQLKKKLEDDGHDSAQIDLNIKDVIIKTIISTEPYLAHQMNMHTRHKNVCFELYGFDVILDSKLKPWILEVNVGPSLSSSSPFDKNLKTKLICDMLTLVGVKPYNKKAEMSKTLGKPRLRHKAESEKITASYGKLNSSPKKLQRGAAGNSVTESDSSVTTDQDVLYDFIDQGNRQGNFSRIFPLSENIDYYSQFFESDRYHNELIWDYLQK